MLNDNDRKEIHSLIVCLCSHIYSDKKEIFMATPIWLYDCSWYFLKLPSTLCLQQVLYLARILYLLSDLNFHSSRV
jgi:hypothetical protein